MNLHEISVLRLINQQILNSKYNTAKDLVAWMGAIQAQDYYMSKWAIGIRLPNSTEKLINSEIDNGHIIRTHLLRPTWHFVSSDDIYWMLKLSAPQIKASMRSRDKELGLTEAIFSKSNSVIEKALRDGKHLTRNELIEELTKSGIVIENNIASHLFMRAEIEGIICSGKIINNKPSYALLSETVPFKNNIEHDEALEKLAQKYFTSHCPATLQDFSWWSGLSVGESKKALEMIKSDLVSETINNQVYWFTNSFTIPKLDKNLVYLLPAYDEFIISYKSRIASLPDENHHKAVSNNGVFRPIIVKNGKILGIWKRTIKTDKIVLETEFFNFHDKLILDELHETIAPYEHFMNKTVEISHESKIF